MGRYRPVTVLDVILLGLLVLSAWGGYRRGAMLQVAGLVGLAVGFVVGAWLAPHAANLVRSDPARAGVALGTVLVLGAIGDAVGSVFGMKLRKRALGTRFKAADAVGGSALSAGALVLAIWFLGLNLAAGPFPSIARSLQHSAVVRVDRYGASSATVTRRAARERPGPHRVPGRLLGVAAVAGGARTAARARSCRPGGPGGPSIGRADRRTGVRPDPPGHAGSSSRTISSSRTPT